jgi:hypothetical protein
MRTTTPLVLLALLLTAGCGSERAAGSRDAAPSTVPAAAATASPATTATPTTTTTTTPTADRPHEIPEDFPLGDGLRPDGDTTLTGPSRDVPGAFLETLCGFTAWPGPPARRTDRLAVQVEGPEWWLTRELVTYDTEDSAVAVVSALRTQVAGCPSAEGQVVTTYDGRTGEDSVTYGTTYRRGLGGTLVQVTRVGRAVLAVTQSSEYSLETMADSVPLLTRDDRPLVAAMGCLSGDEGCGATGAPLTFTPDGVAPFRIGMSVEEVRAAAPDAVLRVRPASCTDLTWTGPGGAKVSGALDPRAGLVSVSSEAGSTAEGVSVGDTLEQLHAAYPDLAHADNGLWFSDQGATSYVFEVAAPSGLVDDIMVTGDDQHCAS